MKNFDPGRNLVLGLLLLAAAWGCPVLHASVATAMLTANPTSISFGYVPVAHTQALSGSISNSSATSVTISQGWVSGNEFQVTGLNLPLTLASGQSATFNVTFTPTTSGSVVGSIFVNAIVSSSNDPNNNSNSALSIPLSGTGTTSGGVLQATSPSINFGNVQLGTNTTQSETLTNSGDSSVTITEANLSDPAFNLTGLNLPLTLLPGQNFTFEIGFAPTSTNGTAGSISIISNASNSVLTISLSGIVSGTGQLSLANTSLDFGSVAVGASMSLTGLITASGSSVAISSATSNSSEYKLSGFSLPFTLAAGQSTSLTFTFTPQASGTSTARISFISNASNSPTVESLTGTGIASPLHSVALSWAPSASSVIGYNIYRSATSGGPYTKINAGLNATTTYTDNTVEAGLTYYYATTAVDARGVESGYSNQVQAVIPSP
jgi:Abnormal spindle-like microcephaly-assoc'd, ASPM-SPD-2-Hydin